VIRKRGDYCQAKVYAGLDPLTGKERYEYDRARTKRQAERVEAALKTRVAEGRSRGTAARTVADLVERWYQWRQGVKEISPTTLEGYRRQIDQRIIPALGRIPVRRLDVETLDGFHAELRRRGKAGGEPLSPSTVRAVHTVLSGSLRQAVAWGWIPHNPARLATPPSVERSDVAPPPVEQVAGLLATALERNPRLGLFLRLAVVLGARRGELCALRWQHVDLDRGEVLLERGVVYVSRGTAPEMMSIMETMERKQPRARRSFTPEFKAEIVELCQRGDRSIGRVARDFDLTETAVREGCVRPNETLAPAMVD